MSDQIQTSGQVRFLLATAKKLLAILTAAILLFAAPVSMGCESTTSPFMEAVLGKPAS